MKQRSIKTFFLLLAMLIGIAVTVDVQAADRIETAGDVLMVALPVAAAGVVLGFKDDDGALAFGKSMTLALGATYGFKYTIDEKRPNGDDQSFPSLHASVSFTSAEFLRKRYGWEYGIPAYIVASFVGYSRVESDMHYTRDVIAGAFIGIASSYLFTQPYEGWTVQPDVGRSSYGIRLSRLW